MASTWMDLLYKVQTSGIYKDSKTFVDKPLKISKDEILAKFHDFNGDAHKLHKFIDEYFCKEGEELTEIIPDGFTESPRFLDAIKDKNYQEFAKDLNAKWKELGRKIKPSPYESSLIHVPEPFTVPGGRFREFYYWDTYWSVQGLLLCQLYSSVKSMLHNMVYLVSRYGFVPNGGREYYLNRSQPPMLIPMAASYVENTNDLSFLADNIEALEKEYGFWLAKRTVTVEIDGEKIDCFQYRVDKATPRDESYNEDLQLANGQPPERRAGLYADLASAAESGWDFSTRWYDVDKPCTLSSISTRDVVPVDLNAFLCWNTRLLMELHSRLGNADKVASYREKYNMRQQQLQKLFWDEERGAYFDYHIKAGKRDTRFFVSMIVPVYTNCHGVTEEEKQRKVQRILSYMRRELPELDSYKCGIPTSMTDSKQQWDYPNCWPPLQHMWIRAFNQPGNKEAQNFAYRQADKWVKCNWRNWRENHYMYEKYNAVTGAAGEGGEYKVQVGFGWTNGVILDLLALYPDLSSTEEKK